MEPRPVGQVFDEAIMLIADRRLRARELWRPVSNPVAWRRSVAQGLRREYEDVAASLDLSRYNAVSLADRLEHPPVAVTPSEPGWRHAKPRNCDGCEGSGWVECDAGGSALVVMRCQMCAGIPNA